MEDVKKLQTLVPKTINILKNILDLYDKKSRGENVKMQELLHVLKNVDKDEIVWALQMMQKVNVMTSKIKKNETRPQYFTAEQIINQGSGMANNATQSINHKEMAQNLLQALFLTTATDKFPSADVLLQTMKITDPRVIAEFKQQYEVVVKKTQKEAKVHPVETNMVRWSWMGKFFFFGGTVLFLLLIIRRMVLAFLEVTQPAMNFLSNLFKDGKSKSQRAWQDVKNRPAVQVFMGQRS
jgi:hypothetical protein